MATLPIRFYNSLSKSVEAFAPITPGRVLMYNCGPTVYDYGHIGNFRSFLFADVLRRFLELAGHEVKQVMNLTDVGHMTVDDQADGGGEDKMQVGAQRLKEYKKQGKAEVGNPDDPWAVAQFFTDAFLEDARAVGLKIANEHPAMMPRATDFIPQMQEIIARLIARGHAYQSGPAVYFSVQSFPAYGRLSGNTLEQLSSGAGGRVLEQDQAGKRHPADFLLWKADERHLMKWPSPWGTGYPGWHIECSAMAKAKLGAEVIDIHTGGEDNIFPHHECEIAQSCCAHGHSHFARYWMHARFLLVDGKKMSKSRGNFFTIRDLLAKGADPAAIRLELIRAHYRSNLDFNLKGLEDARGGIARLRAAEAKWAAEAAGASQPAVVGLDHPALARFAGFLADDLNTAGALAEAFSFVSAPQANAAEALGVLRQMDRVLGILQPTQAEAVDTFAADRCAALDAARKAKDFAAADAIRAELAAAGYEVKTGKEGSSARKKLA